MHTDLVKRACAGDEFAFELLVDEHKEAMFRLAYLMVGDAQDAQDIAQEALLRAYRNLHKVDIQRPLRPWLLKITANACRNHRRSVWRYWNALRHVAVSLDSDQPSPEKQVIQEAEVKAVLEAIRRLKVSEQEIIYLRYFLEMSVETTAEILNIKEGTVKSRLHRALKQLESIIEAEFPMLAKEVRL